MTGPTSRTLPPFKAPIPIGDFMDLAMTAYWDAVGLCQQKRPITTHVKHTNAITADDFIDTLVALLSRRVRALPVGQTLKETR